MPRRKSLTIQEGKVQFVVSLRSCLRFEVDAREVLEDRIADVADVSAASSLLAFLTEKEDGLQQLWNSVDAGGYLPVIDEPRAS